MSSDLISEVRLFKLARQLAKRKRDEIVALDLSRARTIAKHYGLSWKLGKLPLNKDGSYDEEKKTIIVNSRISSVERRKFTFFHELMHHFIRQDGGILSYLHDSASSERLDTTLERLCQIGAAEFVIPADEVRSHLSDTPFSTLAIPVLCEQFGASAPAVAFQMTYCARHECYLTICELDQRHHNENQKAFLESRYVGRILRIIYSAQSSRTKFSIARFTEIPSNHLIWAVFREQNHRVGRADIPFRSGTVWIVDCDALFFRNAVYAFFNATSPVAPQQLSLF